MPPAIKRNKSTARRTEFKALLYTVAARTTIDGTLTALAVVLKVPKRRISLWIAAGEVPAARAKQILKLNGVNPPGVVKITTQMLVPSLF